MCRTTIKIHINTFGVILLFWSSCVAELKATTYMPPEILVVSSEDGSALVRTEPILGSNTIKFHGEATIFLYDQHRKSYHLERSFTLQNSFYPKKVLIANHGAFVVTLDDWPTIGSGPHAIVVYRGSGELIKVWALTEIFSGQEMEKMRRDLFSDTLQWRNEYASIVDTRLGTLLIIGIPQEVGKGRWLHLNLSTGSFVPSLPTVTPGEMPSPAEQK